MKKRTSRSRDPDIYSFPALPVPFPGCSRVLCDWHDLTLHAPYLHFSETDIVKIGINLGVDYSLTWTCYRGEDRPCGRCGACVERREAFRIAGARDPLEYG
jgi:7-cyano-7-deazaguanine synthase